MVKIPCVLVNLKNGRSVYCCKIDGEYNVMSIDVRTFNDKRYLWNAHEDGNVFLYAEETYESEIGRGLPTSQTIKKVMYANHDIFTNKKIMLKIYFPLTMIDEMMSDESITIQSVEESFIDQNDLWKFEEEVDFEIDTENNRCVVHHNNVSTPISFFQYVHPLKINDSVSIYFRGGDVWKMVENGKINNLQRIQVKDILKNNGLICYKPL